MIVLVLRADTSNVLVGLYKDDEMAVERQWQAGRELSQQILNVIEEVCEEVNLSKSELSGIVVYEGPGSYTGLRISISVANAIGYSYDIPVVGSTGEYWMVDGIKSIAQTKSFKPVNPVYGGEVYTTKPKK